MHKTLTLRYGLIQAAYWMSFALVMGFASLYLLDHGFSSTVIGILIAAAGILSALLQPAVAAYADRPDSLSLRTINILVAAATLVCALGVLFFPGSDVLTLLFYGAAIALLQLSTPLINSLAITSVNCGSPLNFGAAKSAGSVSYAAASFGVGALAERLGSRIIPLFIAVFYGLLIVCFFLYPAQRAPAAGKSEKSVGFFGFFRKYPRFTLVLGGCLLVFISHSLLNNFTLQIVRTKGGSSDSMGLGMALAALAELPTMIGFRAMMKRAGSHVWLRICGIFFMLKNLGTLLCVGLGGFYAVQFTQMFAWSLIAVSSVYYINAVVSREDAVKGQAFYTMTYTAATVIGSVIGGRIIDALGVPAMLIFGTVCAAGGAAILLLGCEKTDDRGIAA